MRAVGYLSTVKLPDIVVHGICILLAVMRHLGAEEIRVSEYGNLDGYLRRHYYEEA